MAIQGAKQPSLRFSKSGPFGFQGISYEPKVAMLRKSGISGTENEDFLMLPAETFISQAFLKVDTVVNNSGVVTLGTSADPDTLINATDFDAGTVGNHAVNTEGLYLNEPTKIRLATTGTATEGAVSGFLVYFELASMKGEGIHFDL